MTDPQSGAPTDAPARDQPPNAPRWVKIAALTVGALLALMIVLHLLGIEPSHGRSHRARSASEAATR